MDTMEKAREGLRALLHSRPAEIDKMDQLWDAAVLLPLVKDAGELSFLFEVRALTLKRQPGEICFPGGRVECRDKDFAAAAVRETCEELGLTPADIELCGELDALVSNGGPIIHPFVGLLSRTEAIHCSAAEVQEIFTVPLRHLLVQTPRQYTMETARRPKGDFPYALVPHMERGWRTGKDYTVYFYQYGEYVIWGLTARILHAFLRRSRSLWQEVL